MILKLYVAIILATMLCVQSAEAGAPKSQKADKAKAKTTTEDTSAKVPGQQLGSATQGKEPNLLREKKYFYGSFGTRDPFRSLVSGVFEPKLQDLVDLRTVDLVGVLSEEDEHIAMVEDSQGFGYNLRPGDRVRNGTVVSVGKDAMVARLNVFGQTTRVTLRLQREE